MHGSALSTPSARESTRLTGWALDGDLDEAGLEDEALEDDDWDDLDDPEDLEDLDELEFADEDDDWEDEDVEELDLYVTEDEDEAVGW